MKYFDYAATCPIDPAALDAYQQAALHYFGNTSSLHNIGTEADKLLEHCRNLIAETLGVESSGIYFTSGGTESNFLSLYGLAKARGRKRIVTSEAEHSSIQHALEKLAEDGFEIVKVPFTSKGVIDLAKLKRVVNDSTGIVSIQSVNGEIGTIQPVEEIREICNQENVYFHSDCVQAMGKGFDFTPLDSFSIASHKIYGPKGVGAFYIKPSLTSRAFVPNAVHEKGMRPGTVNLPAIAGFAVAVEKFEKDLNHQQHMKFLKEVFIEQIQEAGAAIQLVGEPLLHHASSIVGLCIKETDGQWTMMEANRKGFAISTGSACKAVSQSPAHTLLSMGYPEEKAKTFIRISFGKEQTKEDVIDLAACLTTMIMERQRMTFQSN
ncbi:IscS subfamily cysteine desulfurase [Halobacillus salinarum]|uniref:IscS subfamily cysteine desulfurase n=1 Tax=Halobacillus salinarum TaxID=2932257 RepID=A0ABY4ELN5_9BACI|nr:IscS subfamily cysteine desulfurase [Halobacillus salinarum]UOQ45079.1 IscS subfamily cysteine desulfurase [Halobacillus salinarum]